MLLVPADHLSPTRQFLQEAQLSECHHQYTDQQNANWADDSSGFDKVFSLDQTAGVTQRIGRRTDWQAHTERTGECGE